MDALTVLAEVASVRDECHLRQVREPPSSPRSQAMWPSLRKGVRALARRAGTTPSGSS